MVLWLVAEKYVGQCRNVRIPYWLIDFLRRALLGYKDNLATQGQEVHLEYQVIQEKKESQQYLEDTIKVKKESQDEMEVLECQVQQDHPD